MTMYKGHKLPTPSEKHEVFTNDDWDRYFECRKKFDFVLSDEEKNKLFNEILKLDPMNPNEEQEWFRLSYKMPLEPVTALAIKHAQGLKRLFEYNLSEAKKAYPNDF